MELAHQLCRPNGPSAKKHVAEALDLARGSLYLQRKQAQKDKKVANAIEAWYEKDETMGHRKLGKLLKMGKNRVKRVMKKYGIAARRKRQKYAYPGKAKSTVPNLLRDPDKIPEQLTKQAGGDALGHFCNQTGGPDEGTWLLRALEANQTYPGDRL